jgi:hypothetical protein
MRGQKVSYEMLNQSIVNLDATLTRGQVTLRRCEWY